MGISIHSLRMEGDLRAGTVCTTPCKFQSTPSAWRETPRDSAVSALSAFQSTPSAWRETGFVFHVFSSLSISIHSLRMEGDCFWALSRSVPTTFQSTPSAWRETASISGTTLVRIFQSTPSAWRETASRLRGQPWHDHFNPLPPHGGRHFPPSR